MATDNNQNTDPQAPRKKMSPARRKRVAIWSFLTVIGLSIVMPLASYSVFWFAGDVVAQETASGAVNQRSEFWRAVRGGEGISTVKSPGAGTLVQAGGNDWRNLRNGPVMQILPWILGGMALLLLLYHLFHGRNKLEHPRSGRKVKRWNGFERLVHWFTAITFIILAVTGLSMLFGKSVMIPLLGKAGFAAWANLSITVHNVVGPAFSIGILLMIVMWIWHNFPTSTDLKWFAQGGGLIGSAHPSAGRMNGGEKVWFWILATVGVAVCISGLILLTPIYQISVPAIEAGGRGLMQQSSLIHAVAAVVWTAVALGHIYIGTAGTEGAFEGMATGYVSEEWAKQHHDLWYAELEEAGKTGGYVTRADLEVMRSQNKDNSIAGAAG